MATDSSAKGRLFRDILAELFRLRAVLLESSERIAASAGLTTARWQILGVIADEPVTVSQIARRLGLTRQSVQETTDTMGQEGLVTLADNPHHRRARLVTPTARARRALAQLQPRQEQFAEAMGAPHTLASLRSTLGVLRQSRAAIEARLGSDET
jgi:DNA-binding MarR family transcriptional regulator